MKTLILALALTFVSQFALATPQTTEFNCKVAKVVDGGNFENEHDFTFADYPHIAYSSNTPDGKTLIVGALSFSEKDESQSSEITEENLENMSFVSAVPEESGQIFFLVVTGAKGRFLYHSQELEAPVEVAQLTCE